MVRTLPRYGRNTGSIPVVGSIFRIGGFIQDTKKPTFYCRKCIKKVKQKDSILKELTGGNKGLKAYHCKDCGDVLPATRYWKMAKKRLLEKKLAVS